MLNFSVICLFFVAISNAIPAYPKDQREEPAPQILQESKDGKFYLLSFPDNHMNWMRAMQLCQANGDRLASFHSKEGNDFAGELCLGSDIESDCWIGGFFDANRKFRWTDGTAVDYQNWDVDQPNNEGDNQYCALMYVRRGAPAVWQDGQCARATVIPGGTSKAICRRKGK